MRTRFLLSVWVLASSVASAQWIPVHNSGTNAGLRGVHAPKEGVVWASGTGGAVLRTEDGGFVWKKCSIPPEGEKLDFRAIWAWDARRAIVMSSGTGDLSRLYETVDGCTTWRLLFQNPDPTGFWDAIAFSRNFGMLVGDPVDGRFTVFETKDLGQHWARNASPQLAADPKMQGVFAASNSSLAFHPPGSSSVFATGGAGGPRLLLRTVLTAVTSSVSVAQSSWTSVRLPLTGGSESAGAFSLGFRLGGAGIVVGGDYKKPAERAGTAAYTTDGGLHWMASSILPSGFRSAVAWEPKIGCWVAVGPNGSDASFDDGKTWRAFDRGNWNALSLPWVVGPQGRIARLDERVLKTLASSQ